MIPFGTMLSVGSLGFLLFLSSCAVDQKKEIATYRKFVDNNQPAGVQIDPNKVLTLTDALKLAVQNEEQLSLQGENYLQALIAKDKAFVNFLPTVSLSAGANYSSLGGPPDIHSSNFNASIPGQLNLFNGFRDYYTVKAANETIEQQKQLIFDTAQTVLLDVAQTYYQVLTSEQSVDVLTNSLVAQDANVQTLQQQLKVGTARRLDLEQAEAQASQTRVSLLQAQADVQTGRAMLVFLVNAPIHDNPLRDDFDPPDQVQDQPQWIADGEAARQDLKAADAAVRSARNNVEVAWGQYYPTLTFLPTYQIYPHGFGPESLWSLLLDFSVPIYTGGSIEADVRQAWSLYRTAALTESQLKRNIDQNVEIAYVDLMLAQKELTELEIQVTAAREEFRLSQLLYQNGGGTYLNVLQAQSTLLSAQLQLTTEQFARKTAYFALLRAVGRLSYTSMQSTSRPSEQQIKSLATQPVTLPSTLPSMPSY